MQRAGRDTHTTTRLLGHLERATTGRLSVGDGATEVSVYVMNGEIVAARSGNDDHQLIRRLWAGQVIDIARVAALEAMAELGESVFGVLLEEVEPDLMEVVLFERFRDNLATFLGHPDDPWFTEMSAVFVDNIQIGHDSHRLAADCAKLWRKALAIDPEMGIVPSHPEDAAGEQLLVMEALGAGRNVRAVLDDVPLEPVWARAMIAGMLDTGIIASSDVEPADASPDDDKTFEVSEEAAQPEISPGSEFATTEIIEGARPFIRPADQPTMETEIIESPRRKPRKLGEVIAEKKSKPDEVIPRKGKKGKKAPKVEEEPPELELDPDEPDFEDDEPTVDSSRPVLMPDVRDLVPPEEVADAEIEWEPDADSDAEPEDDAEVWEPDIDIELDVDATPEADTDANTTAPGLEEPDSDEPDEGTAEAPLDLEALLRPGGAFEVDDELDLDAFADHDSSRGGDAEGAFITDTEHLDRVEVAGIDEEPEAEDDEATRTDEDDEELIEVDEAPHAMFSGRLLSEDEAAKKIDVANQAVIEVIQAFDASEGAGRGRATMQIVLDGSPQRFAVLFQGVKLGEGDELPSGILLRNLHDRPQTEHRQLLNQGLVDLIERALSLAMDEITDDTAIDTLLEKTAGYRQRIGL